MTTRNNNYEAHPAKFGIGSVKRASTGTCWSRRALFLSGVLFRPPVSSTTVPALDSSIGSYSS
jgi:hypothetical protein